MRSLTLKNIPKDLHFRLRESDEKNESSLTATSSPTADQLAIDATNGGTLQATWQAMRTRFPRPKVAAPAPASHASPGSRSPRPEQSPA